MKKEGQEDAISEAVGHAASDLLRVLRTRDDDKSWENPAGLIEKVGRARDALVSSWDSAPAAETTAGSDEVVGERNTRNRMEVMPENDEEGDLAYDGDEDGATNDRFDARYVALAAEAFGDEIEAMRRGGVDMAGVSGGKKKKRKRKAVHDASEGMRDGMNAKAEESKIMTAIDVDVLADCLRTGADMLSDEERRLLFTEHVRRGLGVDTLTAHEGRRRELGFA